MDTEKTMIKEMAYKLVEQETQFLQTVTKQTDDAGFGTGAIEPGTVLNQAVLLGACNYLMHYDFEAIGETHVAYLSRSAFLEATEYVNNLAIEGFVDYLLKLPGFGYLSKGLARKIIHTSSLVNIH